MIHFDSSASHNMSENDVINLPTNIGSRNTINMDGMFSRTATVSSAHSNSFNLNNQNQIMAEFPALSMMQGGPFNNLHSALAISNQVDLANCNSSDPMDTQIGRNSMACPPLGSSRINSNIEVQERFMSVMPVSAAPLVTLLAPRCGPSDNFLNKLDTSSSPSVNPSDILRTSISNDLSDASHSAFTTSINCGFDGMHGGLNNKWDFNKFLACPELIGKIPERMGFQPFQLMGNASPSGWVSSGNANMISDNPPSSSRLCNELSLSLATCQPSIIHGTSIPDQCLGISCSGIAHHSLNERQFGLETSCDSKNISVNFGSSGAVQLSQSFSGFGYLRVIQEILAEIASYSLENRENFSISSSCVSEDGSFEVQIDPVLQGREVEAKKTQLLALLQVVDERYTQCLDEIRTVISTFHAVTELDPHIHTRFALQTVSSLYKNLRERICSQILTMGAYLNKGDTREEERLFETSFIQKQWALQQLRRKDHQLWRPQRGLPERSVSVLRAWMFQNFLHPYPKDADKHLLAVKSGLTRSQVSNWFINARVRLWKPMIEEMYAEVSKRKGRGSDKETDGNRRSLVNLEGQRLALI